MFNIIGKVSPFTGQAKLRSHFSRDFGGKNLNEELARIPRGKISQTA